ncbi:DUF2652 domain-containing protein [Maribacter algicola]|uniref:DUF2652 domain-containing protein n=1 Tax=Maribacter algicola TaxID=2498892 RepID=A0A426RNS4_9FLAO|nr:DUF2652 domain-containing protein [Maribacter algicola]RRQ50637.1 DUF2652 domain-containing protein [Maribacter algicola]
MKATPTLLCIPDISGFTEFMSGTNFDLSSKVIPTLLNKIIYSNKIGLKVSEIEGDAVLFFKTGKLPPIRKLIEQCEHFYIEFYEQLEKLREQYKEEKDASTIPEVLGLKIILHYGEEVASTKVGNRIKLFGEDLIVAHRLLKNKIRMDEYILISEGLSSYYKEHDLDEQFEWGTLKKNYTEYDHVGKIHYHYINLKPLVKP